MSERVFHILVEKVKTGSPVPVGLSLPPTSGAVRVGRSADNDLVLPDSTISSRHVEVRPAGDAGIEIVNESRNGTTALNGRRLERGESARVDGELVWLQLGRVLLRVMLAPETVPVDEVMALPSGACAPVAPLLRVRRVGDQCEVWCCGHAVRLFPSAARLLARLCESPNEVVTHTDLALAVEPDYLERVGGTNVAQLVTYVRSMFEQALADNHLTSTRLVAVLRASGAVAGESLPTEDDDEARRTMLRALVENVRGTGYVLRAPVHEVRVEC